MANIKPPKALVKTPRLISQGKLPPRWREGRGFSLLELREAGLSVDEAKRLGLYVDVRRKSKHQVNVELLREFLEALRKNTS